MIYITDIRDKKVDECDQVWVIVRSLRNEIKNEKWVHVPELSPSWNLLSLYRLFKSKGKWNHSVFMSEYVPIFLSEIKSREAIQKFKELQQLDLNEKKIALVCFCSDERLCHRSIIAGILQKYGLNVVLPEHEWNQDYRFYL